MCTTRYRTQNGTALVFSLLILLIMTIIGVAAMSNTQMQERMAGNVAVQSQAFEAASAGVSDALRFGMNQFFGDPSTTADDPDEPKCTTEQIGDWRDASDNSVPRFGAETDLPLKSGTVQGVTVEYQLRAECFQDPGLDPAVAPAEGYVTSQGIVTASGAELATREVEVRVDDFRADGRSAIRPQGGEEGTVSVDFGAPTSNNFRVDGSNGPAISASTQTNAESILAAVEDTARLANYDGGIVNSPYDAPFNSVWRMARFALEIRAFMEYHGVDDTTYDTSPVPYCDTTELAEDEVGGEPVEPLDGSADEWRRYMRYIDGNFTVNGGTNIDGITYVTERLNMNGSPTGRGLVIVQGPIEWRGTADFQGLIIGLGGEFVMDGGGTGDTTGMLYVANIGNFDANPDVNELLDALYNTLDQSEWALPANSPPNYWDEILNDLDNWGNPDEGADGAYSDLIDAGFGNVRMDFSGGGGHQITYDCGSVDNVRRILGACGKAVDLGEVNFPDLGASPPTAEVPVGNDFIYDGLADPWANQLCNTPGQGGSIQAIRSWRENLGWRELLGSAM